MKSLLRGVVKNGTGKKAKLISPYLGGKTGTTSDYNDAWFMGFNSHPIFNLIDDICQPFYNIIRRILPPMSGLDFSPIILLVLITLTELILVPPIYHFASQF